MEETADMVQSLLEDAPTPSRKFCLRKKKKKEKKKKRNHPQLITGRGFKRSRHPDRARIRLYVPPLSVVIHEHGLESSRLLLLYHFA